MRPSYPLLSIIYAVVMVLRCRKLTFVAPVLQPPQLLTSFGGRLSRLLFISKYLLFPFSGSGRLNIFLFIERLLVAKGGLCCSDHIASITLVVCSFL